MNHQLTRASFEEKDPHTLTPEAQILQDDETRGKACCRVQVVVQESTL